VYVELSLIQFGYLEAASLSALNLHQMIEVFVPIRCLVTTSILDGCQSTSTTCWQPLR